MDPLPSERRRMEKKFADVRTQLKGKKSYRMCFTHSVTISKYPNDYTDRLAQWQQWHQAWVYNINPSVVMRSSMPLPPGVYYNAWEEQFIAN